MKMGTVRALAAVAAVALALGAASSFAELRRAQSVGVAPIRPGGGLPRDAALREALRAAVLQTAKELLPENFAPVGIAPEDADAWLAERLGDDPYVYVSRFGILEDRGRRPAMFTAEPDVEEEYVVLADVSVDVDAVGERLAALGLPVAGAGRSARYLTLVLEGLSSYRPLEVLRDALRDDRSVRSVVPIEFSHQRAVLSVQADRDAPTIVRSLRQRSPEGLQIVVAEENEREATLVIDWRPPEAPDADTAPTGATD